MINQGKKGKTNRVKDGVAPKLSDTLKHPLNVRLAQGMKLEPAGAELVGNLGGHQKHLAARRQRQPSRPLLPYLSVLFIAAFLNLALVYGKFPC